ncbi:MAG TPA: NUDIX domain-containing protein [Crenalkalicoccus sp.]|jgi:ADP-ribose pyrophosphatase|nr:NUDIX domain-containing protein [Crenalkalicoccus sp.]
MPDRPKSAPPIPPWPGLEVLSDEVVWSGRFPVQRVRFRHRRFDGGTSGILTWEMWRRGRAVVVLPYDPWTDRVALIRQFRLPALAAGCDPVVTECPAGLLEPQEPPDVAARRELAEETGLQPDRLERMGGFLLAQGGTDELATLFCARVRLPEPGLIGRFGLTAEQEDIELRVLPAEEAFALVARDAIGNATAALCLLWLQVNRTRLRRDWMG